MKRAKTMTAVQVTRLIREVASVLRAGGWIVMLAVGSLKPKRRTVAK